MREAERALIDASAAIGAGDVMALEKSLDRAAAKASAIHVEEMLLQSVLFAGYPATLRALGLWRERVPDGAALRETDGPEARVERGEQVCRTVYGAQYERLRENVGALHPDLDRWMIEDGYGRVLGRPGLELRLRELCIIALLAAQDSPDPLYSHLRGALNAGATRGEVEVALAAAAEVADPARTTAAAELWRRIAKRNGG